MFRIPRPLARPRCGRKASLHVQPCAVGVPPKARRLSHSTFPLRPVGGRLDYPSSYPRRVMTPVRPVRIPSDFPTSGHFPTRHSHYYFIDSQWFRKPLGKWRKRIGVTRCLETALTLSLGGNVLTLSLFRTKTPAIPSKYQRNLFLSIKTKSVARTGLIFLQNSSDFFLSF